MLQQTQVATAAPFYQRFLARFPTLTSLARSRESDVLAVWSGLGYYRRARDLRAAVRLVVRDHAGIIPDDPDRFGALPGVGRYTTGAVLSLAFGRALPALDGNVARVLSRLFALEASVRDPRGSRALWKLAASLVPARRPGEWNQALMELGARVCVPRGPRCGECPVRSLCRARSLGRTEELPPPAVRRPALSVRRAVALIERGGRLLMARRAGRLLGGLWEPPGVELGARASARGGGGPGGGGGGAAPAAPPRLEAELGRLGLEARLEPTSWKVRHRITHRDISVEVWRGEPIGRVSRIVTRRDGSGSHRRLPTRPGASRAVLRFVDPEAPGVPITALARKLARLPVE